DEDFARSAESFNDNFDRLTKAGKGFLLQVLGPIMPDLVKLTEELVKGAKAVIPMVRGFVDFIRQSKLLQSALTLLTGKGLLVGLGALGKWVTSVGGLTMALRKLMGVVLRFIAPMLILEDLLVFLAGGKSLLGEKLDEWFDEGTADKVRATAKEISDSVMGLFAELK